MNYLNLADEAIEAAQGAKESLGKSAAHKVALAFIASWIYARDDRTDEMSLISIRTAKTAISYVNSYYS